MTTIKLVLGGGGARGFYHAGVLSAIQDLGFKVTEIAGCSIGAVIGAMYCEDPEKDFSELVHKFSFSKSLKLTQKKSGILDPEQVKKYTSQWIKATTFKELKIPLKFNATDINTGEEIIFDKGNLFPGLLASMAVPGIYAPVLIKNRLLVDGGVSNNLPVHLLSKPHKTVICDIDPPMIPINEKSPLKHILNNTYVIARKKHYNHLMKIIRPKKYLYLQSNLDVAMMDFRKVQRIKLYDKGYNDAVRSLSKWS